MTCQAIQDQILMSDDPRALSPDVAAHVASCAACAEFARRAGAIEAAGGRLATPIDSEAAKRQLLRRVRVTERWPSPSRPVILRIFRRPVWGLVAAMLVIGIGLGFYASRTTEGAVVVDQLVDWNLEMADAKGPADREQLYMSRASALDSAVRQASLDSEDRQLAMSLLEHGAWLVKHDDPVDEAERFSELADQLIVRLDRAAAANDQQAMQRLGRDCERLIQRGVHARLQKIRNQHLPPSDMAKRLDRLAKRQSERERRIANMAQNHPNAALKRLRKSTEYPQTQGAEAL
jgi:hypothetical protein